MNERKQISERKILNDIFNAINKIIDTVISNTHYEVILFIINKSWKDPKYLKMGEIFSNLDASINFNIRKILAGDTPVIIHIV